QGLGDGPVEPAPVHGAGPVAVPVQLLARGRRHHQRPRYLELRTGIQHDPGGYDAGAPSALTSTPGQGREAAAGPPPSAVSRRPATTGHLAPKNGNRTRSSAFEGWEPYSHPSKASAALTSLAACSPSSSTSSFRNRLATDP